MNSIIVDNVVQAETSDELPEYLLGSIRVHKLRLEDAKSANAVIRI